MRISIITGSILMALTLVLASNTAYAAVAGRVQFVAGDVQILNLSGSSRVASKGTEVHAGETILTGLRGSAQLRMIDNGFISIRPRSELKIDEYRYNGSKNDSSFFSLVKGNFRALTGMIAKFNRKAWQTRTKTAVLGVRGSDADIGFQPERQLTAVRTLTGGYTLTPRDTSLPPLNVDAGGIGVFTLGSAPVMAASFPFEPPAPPPQPGAGASPHDQPSAGAPAEDERPLPPPPTHVPGVAPGPAASSTTSGDTQAQLTQELPPLPPQFQIASGTTILSAPATTTALTPAVAAPLGSGGAASYMILDLGNIWPNSGSTVIDGVTELATVGTNGELYTVNSTTSGIFAFDSGTATLAKTLVSIPSLGGTPAYAASWGVWTGGFSVVDYGIVWPPVGGFHYAWGDRITTAAELGALSPMQFAYTMVGGTATNEVGATATAFTVTATGSFAAGPTLGTVTVTGGADFATGSTTWAWISSGTVANLINNAVGISGSAGCLNCAIATSRAEGQFVGTKAEGLVLGVHGSADYGLKAFAGAAVLKR
ncbi:FecR domain-containing protein [Pseudomonadota bacterium]